MIDGIQMSAAGAAAQSLRHDIIANNLANANTPGFRRQLAILGMTAPPAGLEPAFGAATGPGLPTLVATQSEAGQGPLIQTGRATDLAIDGEGFFSVTDGRTKYYTRAGNFDVDDTGRLVTADHRCQVLSADGQPIVVDKTQPFSVTDQGEVVQGGGTVGRVGVVAFRDPECLKPAGGNLYVAGPGAGPATTRLAAVQQGYLEQSTVEAVRELVSMLEAYRAYEANVNLIGNQDATQRRLVNETARMA